jgi:hypothetical protein
MHPVKRISTPIDETFTDSFENICFALFTSKRLNERARFNIAEI